MRIILTDINNVEVHIIPFVPTTAKLSIAQSDVNTTEDTINGRVRNINHASLRKIEWSSFFPVNNMNFIPYTARQNGYLYVTFIETMRRRELPIRVIGLSNDNIPMFNFLATIDKFDWSLNKNDDINYSIELNEFPEEFWQWARRDVQLLRRVGLLARNGFGDNINRRLNELLNRINTTIDNILGP